MAGLRGITERFVAAGLHMVLVASPVVPALFHVAEQQACFYVMAVLPVSAGLVSAAWRAWS